MQNKGLRQRKRNILARNVAELFQSTMESVASVRLKRIDKSGVAEVHDE